MPPDPTPTPIPVYITALSGDALARFEHTQEFAQMALAFGAGSLFVIVVLLTAIAVVTGLRR